MGVPLQVSSRVLWAAAALIAIALVVFEMLSAAAEERVNSAVREVQNRYEQLAVELTAELGYVGLIHNFKNCLIRPQDPAYCEAARVNGAVASGLIQQIEAASADIGEPLRLNRAREMVEAYAERIDWVLDGHERGLSIAEIDQQVRFDDRPANEEIESSVERVSAVLAAQLDALHGSADRRSMIAIGLAIGAVGLVLAAHRRSERQSSEELAASNRRLTAVSHKLETLINTSNSSIFGFGAHGDVIIANQAGRNLVGKAGPDRDSFGWPVSVRFLDADSHLELTQDRNPVVRALLGKYETNGLYILQRDGIEGERQVRVSSAGVEDRDSRVAVVIAIDDVSELETQRQQLERSRRLEALGQLTGGIAHDFNNMLAVIKYSLQLAQGGAKPEKLGRYLQTALGATQRGEALTTRLLTFAQTQPGAATSRSVDDLFEDFGALARRAIEASIELNFEAQENDLWIHCDHAQLENALLNLVLNSRDAILSTSSAGQVMIGARALHLATGDDPDVARPMIEISVTDDGPGMDRTVRGRALDPFFTTKSRRSGTGLGLAMVFGFVQSAGGELKLYSEPGVGTTVKLILPRGAADGAPAVAVDAPSIPRGNGETVFLVEDEPELLEVMQEMLESIGYQVVSAASGSEALDRLGELGPIDLLLTDVVMPGPVGGFELAEQVAARLPELPVLYMSGYSGFSARTLPRVEAPILPKPCDLSELAQAIANALRRPAD